jgi:hypothetical protein
MLSLFGVGRATVGAVEGFIYARSEGPPLEAGHSEAGQSARLPFLFLEPLSDEKEDKPIVWKVTMSVATEVLALGSRGDRIH